MNIFITGVAGFIGSNLAEDLLLKEKNVIGLDNFDNFYAKEIKINNISNISKNNNFRFYNGDIRDKELLIKIFSENSIDYVIHLAAKAGVRPSISNPNEYFDVNVTGTLMLLEVMKDFNIKKMIFASSSSIYGNCKNIPFSENENVDFPISPYAASKKAGELICHTYHHLYNFDIFCLRFFTVYGPRQRPDLAIYKFTNALFNNEVIPFFGDGSSKRDYTYIEDIIQGINLAIKNLSGFEIFNLGESRTICLKELIILLENNIGKKANLDILPFQQGDVALTCADISKAKKQLNYNPIVNIEEGIINFIKWYEKNNQN